MVPRNIGAMLCSLIAVMPAFGGSEEVDAHPHATGELRAPLVLTDSQSGFAGVISDVWTIEPDRTFTIERLLEGKPVAPSRSGVLAPEDLEGIVAVLAAQDLENTSVDPSANERINARSMTLTLGGTTVRTSLPPGESLAALACSTGDARALSGSLAVAAAIVDAVGTLDHEPSALNDDGRCE